MYYVEASQFLYFLQGTYQAGQGATSCVEAPAGGYTNTTGSDLFSACPLGTYQVSTGQTACEQCAAGTYQDTTGQQTCTQCPEGTISVPGSDHVTDCVAQDSVN